jgi:hypothetical protein
MISFKKLYIILGVGGCKKDFATGWLGTLPNFVNTRWNIILPTGVSSIDPYYIKEIDSQPNCTFKEILEKHEITLSSDGNLNLAISYHGLNLLRNLEGLTVDQYEIININVADNSMPIVFWEQFAKNFLRYNNKIEDLHSENFLNKFILRYISSNEDYLSLTTEQQINLIDNIYPKYDSFDPNWIKDALTKLVWCKCLDQVPVKYIDYEELFVSGGSRKLCEVLNIPAPDVNHQLWDAMLPFSKTPDEIEFLGKIWKKSDYIK